MYDVFMWVINNSFLFLGSDQSIIMITNSYCVPAGLIAAPTDHSNEHIGLNSERKYCTNSVVLLLNPLTA
jgi:hypothetical protein